MDCSVYQPKIVETFEKVRSFSFEEKKTVYDESKVNRLLDKILELKKLLVEKTDRINTVVEKIEGVTWFNDLDSKSLMSINDLISAIRDLHSTFRRQYVSFSVIRTKGIVSKEIKNFKAAMDVLKETAADLESRFFFLPAMPDFQETTKELSLV